MAKLIESTDTRREYKNYRGDKLTFVFRSGAASTIGMSNYQVFDLDRKEMKELGEWLIERAKSVPINVGDEVIDTKYPLVYVVLGIEGSQAWVKSQGTTMIVPLERLELR